MVPMTRHPMSDAHHFTESVEYFLRDPITSGIDGLNLCLRGEIPWSFMTEVSFYPFTPVGKERREREGGDVL